MGKHVVGNLNLVTIKAFILLDSEGKRMISKYYSQDWTPKEQQIWEKTLWDKTRRMQSDIIMMDGWIVCYKSQVDIHMYVVCSIDENELMVSTCLNSFYDALTILLVGQVEKRTILENLDLVMLALDETIDNGIILEADPSLIAQRVTRRDASKVGDGVVPLAEQTLSQALQSARDQLARSLLN